MKIAHIILCHKNPKQVERLLYALAHPAFDFYLHIDKKVDFRQFEYLSEKENATFIKQRAKIYWAGYGTIQATLNAIEEILPKKYDYINVISGQDFPIQPAEDLYKFIVENSGTEFMTCESIKDEWKDAAVRVKNYHLVNWRIPGKYRIEKIANKVLPARKFPLNFEIVGRSNWFTITGAAASYLINFIKSNPKFVSYFKYCWGADEFIFATALYNSKYKNKIRDDLVYVDWTGQNDGHPRVLVTKDYDKLASSTKFFARKFDADTDLKIIDLLEQKLARFKSD